LPFLGKFHKKKGEIRLFGYFIELCGKKEIPNSTLKLDWGSFSALTS
jgi:hypothetical protein